MRRGVTTTLCALLLIGARASAESLSFPSNNDELEVVSADDHGAQDSGFNYDLALEELNQQVRQGKLPPEAVAQILESISPILDRLDQQGEQIQDLSAATQDSGSVKLVVRTVRESDQGDPKPSGPVSSLPPIPKDSSATTAAAGPATSGTSGGVAISIGGGTQGMLPTTAKWDSTDPMWGSKKDDIYNSPKRDAVRVRASAPGFSSSGGTAVASSGGNGDTSNGASASAGPWAALADLIDGPGKRKTKVARKDGEVKKLVASAVTSFKKRDDVRDLASASQPGGSVLEQPKLSSASKLLRMPNEYFQAHRAQSAEPLTERPDLLGWLFGSLISLLSVRAWFQWRRASRP